VAIRQQCILVGKYSAAARPQDCVFTVPLVEGDGATTVLIYATHAVAKCIGICTKALVASSNIWGYTVEVTRISRAADRLAKGGIEASLRVCVTGDLMSHSELLWLSSRWKVTNSPMTKGTF